MKFIFTCGDVNGIGPEIVLKTINRIYKRQKVKIFFVCPENIFKSTAKFIPPKFEYEITDQIKTTDEDISIVTVLNTGNVKQHLGKPTFDSGEIAYKAIKMAYDSIIHCDIDAMITAPISKTAIKLAGIDFPGHTEILANLCHKKEAVMMFLSKAFNASLLTIHEPIKDVPKLISKDKIKSKLEIMISALKNDLQIKKPKIAVLGLNPHRGEEGNIGQEEIKVINPLINRYNKYLSGTYSADAFFANKMYKNFDLVVGAYHDQVLIPFKMINFYKGVNFTAGLPIVRTSPDHGVAYDIAGKYKADESSLYHAFIYALQIAKNRNKKF